MDSDNESDEGVIEPNQMLMHPMYYGRENRPSQGIEWTKVESFGDHVPQTAPLSDNQVINNQCGFVFKISDTMRVRRFLILGTTGGTFYAKEKELKLENVKDLVKMIAEGKSLEILKEIYDVNKSNRAPKMGPLIFCLALVVRNGDRDVEFRAYQMLTRVCRIPTHLFEFISACKTAAENQKISWGRMARRNFAKWYLSKNPMSLAMAVTKYQQRAGWSHRDVIRLSHPNAKAFKRSQVTMAQLQLQEQQGPAAAPQSPVVDEHNDIFLYCVKGWGALCVRYPMWTVVDPPVERPPEPVKAMKKLASGDATMELGEVDEAIKSKEKKRKLKKKASSKPVETADDKEKSDEEKEAATQEKKDPAEEKKKEPKPPKIKPIRMRFTDEAPNHLKFLQGVEDLKACHDDSKALELIKRFGLVREHVPTRLLGNVNVWRALLQKMPITAMIRNLAKMSSIGLLPEEDNAETKLVCQKLRDVLALRSARIHPLALLMAQAVYKTGRGDKGKLKWVANQSIVATLDEAFYAAFANVEPTGKRFLLALDVSGSMMAPFGGCCLSCREATAALAMLALRTEPVCEVVAFQDQLTPLNLTKTDTLHEALEKVSDLPFGATDCALPMLWAAQLKKKFDCFVVYTDNETYFGDFHPSEATRLYREKSGVEDARLIVVGMTATKFTIADPDDPYMMDIVGFDASTPQLMRDFVASGFEELATTGAPAPDEEAWCAALGD